MASAAEANCIMHDYSHSRSIKGEQLGGKLGAIAHHLDYVHDFQLQQILSQGSLSLC